MPTIAVFNQKGGVGKTTTSLNLVAALALLRRSPAGIDLDPQGHLSLASGFRRVPDERSMFAFFAAGTPLQQLVQTLPSGWRLIPAALALSKIDALHGHDPQIAGRLKAGLPAFAGPETPVLIDCCPMLSVLTLNALVAADRVLIPVSADYLSLQGVHRLSAALDVLEKKLGRRFERRVVVTRFDARRRIAFDVYDRLQQHFGAAVCNTRIAENVSLAESPLHGRNIFEFAPQSPGARDYRSLAQELLAAGFFDPAAPQPVAAVA
ncbi:MAG: ParA family protein [Burkholderiales bacterium]|nr:ParA family protein [Burkholderiales bacterium]